MKLIVGESKTRNMGMKIVGYSRPRNCLFWSDWFWSHAEHPFPGYMYRWYRVCGVEIERRTVYKQTPWMYK